MRFLLGYLMIGFLVGVWTACTVHQDDRILPHELRLARALAIPAQMVLWPVELLAFLVKLLSGVRR